MYGINLVHKHMIFGLLGPRVLSCRCPKASIQLQEYGLYGHVAQAEYDWWSLWGVPYMGVSINRGRG